MKVSVSITTYNHEDYISQAIESVLRQKTHFAYEIIIGEDDSDDGTRSVVKQFKEQYPDIIRLFLNDRRNVIYIDGKPTGRWNLINNLRHAHGDYIALLEGDDYWFSEEKLQAQVEFLDTHPECAMCFHDVVTRHDDFHEEPWTIRGPKRQVYSIEDLLEGNFIPTCSVMFRNGLLNEFPDWFFEVPMGDWPLFVLISRHGSIGYIDEIMGCYRVHSGGYWSSQSEIHTLQRTIEAAKKMMRSLSREHRKVLEHSIAEWYSALVRCLMQEGEFREASLNARKCLYRYRSLHTLEREELKYLFFLGFFRRWARL